MGDSIIRIRNLKIAADQGMLEALRQDPGLITSACRPGRVLCGGRKANAPRAE